VGSTPTPTSPLFGGNTETGASAMPTITLLTSLQTIDDLHALISSGKTVSIDSKVLERLLIDHSNMFKTLKISSTVKLIEPRR
jgi:hypothetical protein